MLLVRRRVSASGFSSVPTSAEKLGAVGFKFRRLDGGFWDHEVRSPDRPIVGGAETAPSDQGLATRQPLSFDEELVESWMCAICPMRRKSELQVAGQLQLDMFCAMYSLKSRAGLPRRLPRR